MDDPSNEIRPRVIDGRLTRKASNALRLTFYEGESDPLADAKQSAADGKGAKLGVLFGFRNGATGRHVLTYPDGRELVVHSREGQPTLIQEGTGADVATIHRVGGAVDRSTAITANGREVVTFASDPAEPVTREVFRVALTDAEGADLGRLHVIRRVDGWKTLSDIVDSAWTTYVWWDQAGQSLPLPLLGTRLILLRDVTSIERDALLSACVDLAIGLRPYIVEMN